MGKQVINWRDKTHMRSGTGMLANAIRHKKQTLGTVAEQVIKVTQHCKRLEGEVARAKDKGKSSALLEAKLQTSLARLTSLVSQLKAQGKTVCT